METDSKVFIHTWFVWRWQTLFYIHEWGDRFSATI